MTNTKALGPISSCECHENIRNNRCVSREREEVNTFSELLPHASLSRSKKRKKRKFLVLNYFTDTNSSSNAVYCSCGKGVMKRKKGTPVKIPV